MIKRLLAWVFVDPPRGNEPRHSMIKWLVFHGQLR